MPVILPEFVYRNWENSWIPLPRFEWGTSKTQGCGVIHSVTMSCASDGETKNDLLAPSSPYVMSHFI